ncbi:MAG: MerR family transcriptional regulator [Polynucleobacter sp.]|nr:MerR family transcriptional regulator [Polynucleobacter sp.]
MNVFESFRGFWGTAAELSERAKTLGKAVGVKPEKLTMRLIRYYAAQGVLDKPNRLGREAAFHFKHMLQLLVARKLVDEGVPLEVIGKFNLDASMEKLEQELLKPEKDRATIITETYRKEIIRSKNTPNNSKQQLLEEELVSEINEWKKNTHEERIQLQKTAMNFEILLESFKKEQNYLLEKIKYDQDEKVDSQLRYLQDISNKLTQSQYDKEKQAAYMEYLLKQIEKQFDEQQKQFYEQQKLIDEQHFFIAQIKYILDELVDDKSIITKVISKFKKMTKKIN